MSAELSVLGAGSILPRRGYGPAGYALRPGPGEPVTLLDCGPGSLRALGVAGIGLDEVRRVVFSHYHLDHCLDVFALAFARRNPRFQAPPIELCGPAGLERLVEGAPRALGRWARDPCARLREVAVDREGRGAFAAGGMCFTCVENGHSAGAVSWRIELPGGAVLAYSGDTGAVPAVARLARGADLFVLECSFPDAAAVPTHLSPTSAGRMAQESGAAACLLTHFYPETDPRRSREIVGQIYSGTVHLARDGSVHRVG